MKWSKSLYCLTCNAHVKSCGCARTPTKELFFVRAALPASASVQDHIDRWVEHVAEHPATKHQLVVDRFSKLSEDVPALLKSHQADFADFARDYGATEAFRALAKRFRTDTDSLHESLVSAMEVFFGGMWYELLTFELVLLGACFDHGCHMYDFTVEQQAQLYRISRIVDLVLDANRHVSHKLAYSMVLHQLQA